MQCNAHGNSHRRLPRNDMSNVSLVENQQTIMDMVVRLLAPAWLNLLRVLLLPRLKIERPRPLPCRLPCERSLAMPGMAFLQAAESPAGSRPSKRTRADGGHTGNKSLEQQVQDLSKQMQKICQIVVAHDSSIREMEAWSTRTWLLDPQCGLATQLTAQMEAWKGQLQQGQAHPLGPSRLTVGATIAKWVLDGPDRKASCPTFSLLHDKMDSLEEMHSSVQLAFSKPIKDRRILLKVRPQLEVRSEWTEVFKLLDESEASETKGVAPPGSIVRDLKR